MESEVRIHGPVDVILSVGLFVVGLVLRQQLQLLLRAPLSREPCGSDLDDPTQLQHLLLDVMVIASQQCDVGDETRVVPQPVGLDVGARAVDDFEDSANGQRPDRFTHRCSRHVQEPGQLGLGRQWRLLFEHSIADGVEDLSDGLLDSIASHAA